MSSSHRRRTTVAKAVALGGLAAALALGVAAIAASSTAGVRMAAVVGALTTFGLAWQLLRSERALPAEVGRERARQATAHAQAAQRLRADQRHVLDHLGRRLAACETQVFAAQAEARYLRRQLDAAKAPFTMPSTIPAAGTVPALAALEAATDEAMADLWPDLDEAPTIVDLLMWDEQTQTVVPAPRRTG